MRPRPPTARILDAARLLGRHGGLMEARILKAPVGGTVSGYFTDREALARAVARWDGRATIYVTLNPVVPALLARANNRLRTYARETTADRDIVCRVWLPLDFDPVRPAGIASTDDEVKAALTRRNEAVAFLAELGFQNGVSGMSGNGAHALYAIDLPNDETSTRLVEQALAALAARFSDNVVMVDTSVFNAARIWKLYGTVAIKGDATPDRPHRRAELDPVPAHVDPVDRDALAALAAMAPGARVINALPKGSRVWPSLDLVTLVQTRGLYLRRLHSGKHAITCPWADEHSGDSGLTETVLFEPKAEGEPWGFDCKHAHCAERTIRDVLGVLGLGRNEPTGHREPGAETSSAVGVLVVEPYTFTPAVDAGHFLADYIAYASARTDAAHELHEAAGLILLAGATPNVRAMLSPSPGGLATNLYVLVVGDSTLSRKSTAKDIARDLHQAVIPNGQLPDLTSPEAFIEQLAQRPDDSSTWFVDEMGDYLDKLHHAKFMRGMLGLLLTVYGGQDYRYSRHSKRLKGGETVKDEDFIRRPHLSILGATTPAVFDVLTGADVRSGLLPRFAIVMPRGKPPRAPFYGTAGWDEARRGPLAASFHRLYTWACSSARRATFAPGVLETLDIFAAALEREADTLDEAHRPMLRRLAPMAVKVAMLVAAGRPDAPDRDVLVVDQADARAAIIIAERWRTDAITFAGRIGETEFERQVERCLRVVSSRRQVPRRVVAQLVHLPKRTLDDVEATLVDRGLIAVARTEAKGRPTLVTWEYQGA